MTRYPVYIISKGRWHNPLTAAFMMRDGLDFKIVIEPQEQEQYAKVLGRERLLLLPFSNLGQGSIPARNWVWEHSLSAGHKRHWIFDDNIRRIGRRYKGVRITCNSQLALQTCEQFVDRYENIGIAGLNYAMFVPPTVKIPPFYLNVHVYSAMLIDNNLPFRWRGRYNEDTDLCLRTLAHKLCTMLFNIFFVEKIVSMLMKGGNTDELYQGDGRLVMSRSLERLWPNVVTTKRRFRRPQHVIKNSWRKFDTPLIRRKDIDWETLEQTGVNEHGIQLHVINEIKHEGLKQIVNEYHHGNQKETSGEA